MVDLKARASTRVVVAASEPATRLLRAEPRGLVGRSMLDFTTTPGEVQTSLALLEHDTVESYQAPRRIRREDDTSFPGRVWARRARHDGRSAFLVVFADESSASTRSGPLGFTLPPHALPVVPGLDLLSAREREVVDLLLAGWRVPAIAESVGLARPTVRNHLSAAYAKLGVHTQAELIALFKLQPPR